MDWWSVNIEARTDGAAQIADDAVDRFLALTEPYSGTVSMGGDPARWSAIISLEAAGAAEAVAEGMRVVTLLAADAGLPVWPVVRAEATREDLFEEDLLEEDLLEEDLLEED
jgi:hypothetical protein